ncbi:hypothetical protein GCM10017752_42590 [Streptomyces roseoviridis]
MGPVFTLRNQAYAESVQITKNLTHATGLVPRSRPTEKDARDLDLVAIRPRKRSGSQSDHKTPAAFTATVAAPSVLVTPCTNLSPGTVTG